MGSIRMYHKHLLKDSHKISKHIKQQQPLARHFQPHDSPPHQHRFLHRHLKYHLVDALKTADITARFHTPYSSVKQTDTLSFSGRYGLASEKHFNNCTNDCRRLAINMVHGYLYHIVQQNNQNAHSVLTQSRFWLLFFFSPKRLSPIFSLKT